ncbi:alpha/beta fold hydrolase BchO [Afifella sp. IM 167]|uniref:alpha/beta fold hydrolase BchO n=1 Tax=Afifella sp. IM 167 TaxID=2033586 RepID=UPI001CCFB0E4|nr:alpha/beta fold hydrolase BchO [Afifella sp. IM 167]MBZ8132194.1 alpha/beta hydrolase [Afifella sp. IM 167]
MPERLNWDREGRSWPNRDASRFVEAAGLTWHVQEMGEAEEGRPLLLLVHGTGATTHSWGAIMPILARHFCVVAMDLPGHGFTDKPAPERLSMPGMAKDLAALLAVLDIEPEMVVGHSAGAAILMRMCLDGLAHPSLLVSLNGALLPLSGMAGQFFSPVAKVMARSTLSAHFFSWSASVDRRSVTRLIDGTGSKLPRRDIEWYELLARNTGHVWAAINMMANWELGPLERDMAKLRTPLVLVAAGEDRSISPQTAFRVKEIIPAAEVEYVTGLGHLAHEEDPQVIADLFLRLARTHAILG